MKRILITIVLGAFLMGACAPISNEVKASEVWARPGMMGGNSAIYMMLVNDTNSDDELLSASSGIARAVELHESKMGPNGEMQMVPQTSVPLAAGGKVEFRPGGLHIMLIDLKQELKSGDQFEVTLHFGNHADITVTVTVTDTANMDM